MILKTPHCPWFAVVDGDDLVVRHIMATAFGGGYDAGDNGETESGVMNDGRDPKLLGCALPIRSTEEATRLSPLAFKGPHIPWNTKVRVWRDADGEDKGIECLLIDNGPDVLKYPTHALDLTVAAAMCFGPAMPARQIANRWGAVGMSYRILDGARWVS